MQEFTKRILPIPDPPPCVPTEDDEEMTIRQAALEYRATDPIYNPPEEPEAP